MQKAIEIVKLTLLQTWREKSNILWMVALPLLLSFIFGSAMGGDNGVPKDDIYIAVNDMDNSALSKEIIRAIDENVRFAVKTAEENVLRRGVREGDYGAGIIIPKGFEGSVANGENPLQCSLVAMDVSNIAMTVLQITETEVQRFIVATEAGDIAAGYAAGYPGEPEQLRKTAYDNVMTRLKEQPLIDVEYSLAGQSGIQRPDSQFSTDRVFLGFMVMFVTFTVTYAAGDILDEKRQHTWQRLLAAPAGRTAVLGGKMGGAYLLGIIQMIVLYGIGMPLFGIKLSGNVAGALAVMAAFMFTVTCIGLFMSTVVKTYGQMEVIGSLVITATSMLGCVFWPIEATSKTMQKIAEFMPQYWAIKGVSDAVFMNASMALLLRPVGLLLILGGVFFATALMRLRYQEN